MPHQLSYTPNTRISTDSIRLVNGGRPSFTSSVIVEEIESNVWDYHIHIGFERQTHPPLIQINWFVPIIDVVGKWHPTIGPDRSLTANWGKNIQTYATLGAPVVTFFSAQGNNRHTFALSDAINPISIRTQVEEEDAAVNCRITLFDSEWPELDSYEITIRIDERPHPYHQAIASVSQWWSTMPSYQPAPVPDIAYEPVYSTWYSSHQKLSDTEVEANCRWSKTLGCHTVILDDGWQTEDNNKGYAYCGDWDVAPSKFPDFCSHVAKVRDLGMKYLVWYSVPFVGPKSKAWQHFKDKILLKDRVGTAACLDPRFASVRQSIIDCYRQTIQDNDIDGLKLDFVDRFTAEKPSKESEETPDMVSVPVAADRLFTDIMTRLRELKPDVLIEFRQAYIGPAMRKYGNIFRAHDCPNDARSNLVRTIDLRLLSGNTAVHSDMVMWNPNESVEEAAQQLWATLFSVPQISVKQDSISKEQEKMLRTFLEFWTQRKNLLMHGQLNPIQPLNLYPSVNIEDEEEVLVATYQDHHVVQLPATSGRKLTIVNATHLPSLYIDFSNNRMECDLLIFNCQGEEVGRDSFATTESIHKLVIPSAGYAIAQV